MIKERKIIRLIKKRQNENDKGNGEKKIKFTKHEDDTEIEFYINNK